MQFFGARQPFWLTWLACSACLLAFVSASFDVSSTGSSSASVNDPSPTLTLLTEAAENDGAVCLDGSPGGYYYQQGNSSKWMIFLEGGAWCVSLEDCSNRTQTALGSSKIFSEWPIKWQGALSFHAEVNPEFADWSKVWISYCDGASFSGDASQPVHYNGKRVYFRGRRIFTAAIQHLLQHKSMYQANQVILTGSSAGGLAVLFQIDYLRTLLPSSMSLRGLCDSGYFPDLPNRKLKYFYRDNIRADFTLQNATTDQTCMTLHGRDGSRCAMAQYVLPFVSTPVFVASSQYDIWQLQHIMLGDMNSTEWTQCIMSDPHTCTNPIQLAAIQNYRNQYVATLSPLLTNSFGHGAFLHSCFGHGQAADDSDWATISVNGRLMNQAFGDWYFRRPQPNITLDTKWPNNPSCQQLIN